MSRRSSKLSLVLSCLCTAPAALAQDTPYAALTNNVRSFTNFNAEVVRGFVIDGEHVYSVNSYESTIVHHGGLSSASGVVPPAERWRTLNNPVSIARHGNDLYVVGQGNHALARHAKTDGRMLEVLALPSEPADLVIDAENETAWVSCMGADVVVQIDIGGTSMSVVDTFDWADGLRLKRPRFLWLDPGALGPGDNTVLVAPLVSGNNTLITNRDPAVATLDSDLVVPIVRDGNDTALFSTGGLPDQDLFRIVPGDPLAPTPTPGTAVPIVRGAGSLMLAHGRHPTTGEHWMLNVEERNLDSTLTLTEHGQRGLFATNRLARATIGTGIVSPSAFVDLDDHEPATPGNQYARNRSVSFPYALAFSPLDGRAAIAGATSPVIVLTDSSGLRVAEFKTTLRPTLPAAAKGLVPRTLLFDGSNLLVYCQQTGNVQVWNVAATPPAWVATLSLGNDPTPDDVAKGRAIFYDGMPSLDGRTSCNTCHPGGGADGLVWQIEDAPVDHKSPMVTQTLLGIEDTFPYHWRGERDLADFNAAFPGLLGHDAALDTTPGGKLDQFMEFVFSLTPPANPLQPLDRVVRDSPAFDEMVTDVSTAAGWDGNPVTGSGLFNDTSRQTDMVGSCTTCHLNPTGTNGDFNVETESHVATRSVMKVAHLDTQLTLKNQPWVDVVWNGVGGSFRSNLLGSGPVNTGQILNLAEFIDHFFGSQTQLGQRFTPQESAHVAAFVQMFDTGTASAVHHAVRVHATSSPAAIAEVQTMIDQALPPPIPLPPPPFVPDVRSGGVGIVVIGRFPLGGVAVDMTWYFDGSATPPMFVPADAQPFGPTGPTLAPQPFSAFQGQALADNFFLGAPPGNERRLGADYDDDGLDLRAERNAATDPWTPDTDGDGWSDGTELANGSSPTTTGSTPPNVALPDLVTTQGANAEVEFVNASQIKLRFRTTEPARWSITLDGTSNTLSLPPVPLTSVSSSRLTYDTLHTALVHGLEPSTLLLNGTMTTRNNYFGSVTLTDEHGASQTTPLVFRFPGSTVTSFDTRNNQPLAVTGKRPAVITGLAWTLVDTGTANEFRGEVKIKVSRRIDGPAAMPAFPNRIVVAQLLRKTATTWEPVPEADILPWMPLPRVATNYGTLGTVEHLNFKIHDPGMQRWYWKDPLLPDVFPGPFLVLPATDQAGETTSGFRLTNIGLGQKVLFNVLAIEPTPAGYSPQVPNLTVPMTLYQMPPTPEELRALESP